jgi:hypothetical protein
MSERRLSDDHRRFLLEQAVDPDLAERLGVFSVSEDRSELADVPDGELWFRDWTYTPYIAFPWTSPSGRVEWQVRSDEPPLDKNGRPKKYVYRSKKMGYKPVLWAVHVPEDAHTVLIVEGTKQCLAAASYAPEGVAVYGIGGCRMWQSDGLPIKDLALAEDRAAVILLDADAAGNPDVYDAGIKLGAALKDEGATSVKYARINGGGEKDGLDDVLGAREEARRASYLARVISNAAAKPADKRPTGKAKKTKEGAPPPVAGDGRKTVIINGDQKTVKDELTAAIVDMFSGTQLFNHGQVISRYQDGRMSQLDRGAFNDVSSEAALMVTDNGDGEYVPGWANSNVMTAVLSRASYFAPLERLARAPFVRADGSICSAGGYDKESRTILALAPELEGMEVPEDPTPEQVSAARDLLMVEMMGDFPFESDADRANALALMITPAIRGMVSTAPLAVIDGRRKGVGKGKVASCLALLHTGADADMDGLPDDDEEVRKKVTSILREGVDLVLLDEAHRLTGGSLARVLTAATWKDRILGGNRNESLPNRSTWVSLGNSVQVEGDIDRRVYRIAIGLTPGYSRPEDRPASSFRHPELEQWVAENRRELLGAVLTLVRAWFAAGRPCDRELTFQSFTAWERVVAGVLEVAGVKGFLDNRTEWRQSADPKQEQWDAHFFWLQEHFGSGEFTAADVVAKALEVGWSKYVGPPGSTEARKENHAEWLGYLYRTHRTSEVLGLALSKVGKKHRGVNAYALCPDSATLGRKSGGDGGDGGTPTPTHVAENRTPVRLPGNDATTGDAHDVRSRKKSSVSPTSITSITTEPFSCPAGNRYHTRPGGICSRCGSTPRS